MQSHDKVIPIATPLQCGRPERSDLLFHFSLLALGIKIIQSTTVQRPLVRDDVREYVRERLSVRE